MQTRGEGLAHGWAGAEEQLRRAGWEAGFGDEFEKLDGGQRRRLGGLEDAAIARGEAGRELPRRHEQRIVPRDDLSAYADWLADDH